MPVYEYECARHGLFEAMTPMARHADPSPCPTCDLASARVLSAVNLASMPRASYVARERNERSQHEPRMVKREAKPERDPSIRPALRASHGSRPWALEHG